MRNGIEIGDKTPGFSLIGSDGMIHTLIDYKGFKGVCFFFFSLNCEYSKELICEIIALKEQFKTKSIAFVGICKKDTFTSFGESLTRLAGLNMGMDTLLEATGDLFGKFGVMVTPHFFIFNQSKHLIYSGLLKDQKTNYVSLALDQLVGGIPISTPKTEPVGSIIQDFAFIS
jgi:peroxiredoxin